MMLNSNKPVFFKNYGSSFFNELENLMEGSTASFSEIAGSSFQPKCDIGENEDYFFISMDVPGVKKEDIKVETRNNKLLVSGSRLRKVAVDDAQLSYTEKKYGKFQREFSLPGTIDFDQIEASFEDGVLSIVMHKTDLAKGRTIDISDKAGGILNKVLNSKKDKKQ